MATQNMSEHNDEIDLKDVFRTILKYKVSIMFIAFLFLIFSSIFAYCKPNIYSSNSSIEILEEDNDNLASSEITKAFGGSTANIDNEIAVLKSRFIIQKALETLSLTTRYYSTNSLYKTTELYKDSPIMVNTKTIEDDIYGKTFELIPKDDKSFRLIIKPISIYSIKSLLAKLEIKKLKNKDKITYNKVHKYGEEISTPWFTFTVNKVNTLNSKNYSFKFLKPDSLFNEFSKGLSAETISEYASIITLNYKDNVSLRAKEILNAISNSYISQGIDQKTKVAELTLGFIDSQLNNINTKLNNSETDLQNYKITNKVIDLGGKVELATTKVAEYEAEQLKLQTEINILTNLKHFMDNNSDLGGLTIGTINFVDKDLGSLVTKLQKITDQRNLYLVDYTEIHPEVIKLTKSISSTKQSIKKALAGSLGHLNQRKKDLDQMIRKYNKSLESLPSQEKALAELSRPLKVNQHVYEYLLQKKAETAILKSSTISNARVLDAARNELLPIKPNRKLIVLIGLILGLIVGISLAFLRKQLTHTIQSAEEIEKTTSLPIYGVIPFYKNNITKNIFTEAFRTVRTNLHFLPGNEENKVICITSSVSGEGKTTSASTLAKVLASGNKKVIVLDLDMRNATLHEAFNTQNDIGMSNFLSSKNKPSEVIKETDVYGLEIITAGYSPSNPSELLLSPRFPKLLNKLKERYDYIVIDTSPIGLVSDATIVMNYSDITLNVIRANYTRKAFIQNIDKMAKDHSNCKIGIILNATQASTKNAYGYNANYVYGYSNAQYYKN